MHYFFGKKDIEENIILIENEEAHHCAIVLRLKEKDVIGVLIPDDGCIYTAQLIYVHKKICKAQIIEKKQALCPEVKFHLILSPPKNNERLEWLIEKCTELQVASVSFIFSKRCIRKTINIQRLIDISKSAAKQSANPYLPIFDEFSSVSKFLAHKKFDNDNICWLLHCLPSDSKIKFNLSILEEIKQKKAKEIYYFIGPEGDWTIDEIEIIKKDCVNLKEIDLGSTRLRTETAAIMIASLTKLFN